MEVKFDNIRMSFDGTKEVLRDINFKIPEGKLVSILGPSGCGKSTTLMLISGLTFPTEGEIYFGDQQVTKHDAVKRKVGMVFQNYALYPHLTVLENIMFPLKMLGVKKSERRERAFELAKLVHIDEHTDKKPKELSGGQQQRVAIARALAKRPSILLMDEPLSNLDARLRIEMRQEIRRIQQETGVTTVFVTHDQEEALSISDEVMVLHDGNLQQYTDPITLYEKPSNLFVAKFIGTPVINTLQAAEHADLLTKLGLSAALEARVATLGLRAEDLSVVSDESRSVFEATVDHVERVGKDTTLHLTKDNAHIVATDIDRIPEVGERVMMGIDPQKVHYFDQAGIAIQMQVGDHV